MGKIGRGLLQACVALAAPGLLCAPAAALAQETAEADTTAEVAPACEAPTEPAEYVLPATGLVWTFPPDPADLADCVPPGPPPPVRPPAPDLFRMAAVPEDVANSRWSESDRFGPTACSSGVRGRGYPRRWGIVS